MVTRRRRVRASKFFLWIASGLALGLMFYAAIPLKLGTPPRHLIASSAELPARSALTNTSSQISVRRVYPYSIIPGGVQDVRELTDAIGRDPLVAAHYLGFDVTQARVVQLTQEKLAYVSYRRDNRIFWTKQKVRLGRGETVITDGKLTARTRCGNLVSETPVDPTSPREPAKEAFDTPESVPSNLISSLMDLSLPLQRPNSGSTSQPDGSIPGNVFVPLLGPVAGFAQNGAPPLISSVGSSNQGGPVIQNNSNGQSPTGQTSGGPSTPTNPGNAPGSDPSTIVTPEPGTMLLVSSGTAVLWLLRKRPKK